MQQATQGRRLRPPYLVAVTIEEPIERAWPRWVSLDKLNGNEIGSWLQALIVGDCGNTDRPIRAQWRLPRLDAERVKLVQMAYPDAIPMDLLEARANQLGAL
jgi:hypothetical protein